MLTSATEAEFTTFLATYGYTVAADAGPLLALSFVFLSTLPWRDAAQESTPVITDAQCFVAYSMSAEGGRFNPSAKVDNVFLTKKKVETLEQQFEVNESLTGTDAMSLLRSLPMAYGLLGEHLSEAPVLTSETHRAGVFWV